MGFNVLFDENIEENAPASTVKRAEGTKTGVAGAVLPILKSKKVETKARGCEACPSNNKQGVNKLLFEPTGKEIMFFTLAPGPQENTKKQFMVGDMAEWLWAEFRRVGIEREQVDVQATMRCFPTDVDHGSYRDTYKMRKPTKDELLCCSLHTETFIAASRPKHIVVFGKEATLALLRSRSMPANRIYYDEQLQATVYALEHPAFFVKGYGQGPRYDAFCAALDTLAENLHKGEDFLADPFAYVKQQNYKLVLTPDEAWAAIDILQSKPGKKIALDVEDAEWGDGRRITCCGFSVTKGESFVFMFKHKDVPENDGDQVLEICKSFITNPKNEFVMHYGCSDEEKWDDWEGVTGINFTHDTMLSEYLRFSDRKAYGLEACAESRFHDFATYKNVVVPEMLAQWVPPPLNEKGKEHRFTKDYAKALGNLELGEKFIKKHNLFDMNVLSLETYRLRNGGDADLTKRIQVSNNKYVSQPLMDLYIDSSRVLYKMQPNGPLFDYQQHERLTTLYPRLQTKIEQELQVEVCKAIDALASDEEYNEWVAAGYYDKFNAGSPDQVFAVVFDLLDIEWPYPKEKRNTRKTPMKMMGKKHKFPLMVLEYRRVARTNSTYLVGYLACAEANNDRLRTKWNITGTRTGRLASSGDKKTSAKKMLNLQNIKRDVHIQNMCVSDVRWRVFYSAAIKILKSRYAELIPIWDVRREDDKNYNNPTYQKQLTAAQKQQEAFLMVGFGAELEAWVLQYMPDLKTYLAEDYGQIEVRIMAFMSGDANLLKDCAESDIHTRVGVTMTGWDAERIANDEATRTLTKNVHFGIIFGINENNLYEFVLAMSPEDMQGRITKEEVIKAYRRYFERYPGVKIFHTEMRAFAVENNYVETLFGMRQHLRVDLSAQEEDIDELFDEDSNERSSYWGNQAVNGPVQGSAHQLMLCGLVNLIRQSKKYAMLGIPVLEIHDALYSVVDVLRLPEAYKRAKYLLESDSVNTVNQDFPDIGFDIPIVVDIKAGLRLGTKVKLKEGFTIGEFLSSWVRECRHLNLTLGEHIQELEDSLEPVAV